MTTLEKRERWWTWHWDFMEVKDAEMTYESIKRWRRGSFCTFYRKETWSTVHWWIYLPFNIGLGFSYEKGNKDQKRAV